MTNLMPFDELNVMKAGVKERKVTRDDFFDYFVLTYMLGAEEARNELKTVAKADNVLGVVDKLIAGETAMQRVDKYLKDDDVTSLDRVLDTETTRIFNNAKMDVAKASQLPEINKTWVTMGDDKVRDTHTYLEGITVPYDVPFATYDGDYAMFPGGFERAENNANCRCKIVFSV